jgi:hypothetical protein
MCAGPRDAQRVDVVADSASVECQEVLGQADNGVADAVGRDVGEINTVNEDRTLVDLDEFEQGQGEG